MSSSTKNSGSVSVEIDGKTYTGTWELVKDSLLTVTSEFGSKKSTQLGGSTPANLAKMLLSELVRESKPK